MVESLVDGVLAGYGIAIPVGAIAILIVTTGMSSGFPSGFSAGAGAATGDLVYAALAVVAGTAVARTLAPWAGPIRLVSAVVLLAIAVAGLAKARDRRLASQLEVEVGGGHLARTYARFVALTMINPLTVVYFTTLVLGLEATDGRSTGAAVVFVAGAFLASLSWQTMLATVGALAGHGLSPRFRLIATIVGNVFIIGLAIRIVA
jgi:threonine/homoserine/homoserine lactone efflux protein